MKPDYPMTCIVRDVFTFGVLAAVVMMALEWATWLVSP